MAELGIRRLKECKAAIFYLATVQADGSPQVHPVCPVIAGAHLYVSIGSKSPKLHDLRRDGRYMLHALPGKDDDEFSVRGRATQANDPATRAQVIEAATATGLNVNEDEVIFRFQVERVDTAYWENVGQPNTRPVRKKWVAEH
jgi:hypothetical protein